MWQIKYAQELLDELHPIAKTPLFVVYPGLRPFRRCLGCIPQMQYEETLQTEQEHEMSDLLAGQEVQSTVVINGRTVIKKKVAKVRKQVKAKTEGSDPLDQLGFGIVAYTTIMNTMIWLFVGFSLLLVPTMINYRSGDAYAGDARAGHAVGMISNMGYSTVECQNSPVSLGQFTLTCPYGAVGTILDYGVNNPVDGSPVDACVKNSINKACSPNNQSILNLLKKSYGQEFFQVSYTQSDLYVGAPARSCTDTTSSLFVQYTCVQTPAEQSEKYEYLVLAVASTTLISLLFVLTLQMLFKGGKVQQLEWDLATVTAGDYTVEFEIPATAYSQWYAKEYKKGGGEFEQGFSPALSLKRFMIGQIEGALKEVVDRKKGDLHLENKATDERALNENVSVADMVFAYNNSKLIHALRDRGNYIALQKFDQVQKQDRVVNALFRDYESLTRPTACYITFEEEDAANLALELQTDRKLLGLDMKFKKASEPTDIIWENRIYTAADYFFRSLLAYCIIIVMLMASFSFIYKVARMSAEIAIEFPVRDCDAIKSTYGT